MSGHLKAFHAVTNAGAWGTCDGTHKRGAAGRGQGALVHNSCKSSRDHGKAWLLDMHAWLFATHPKLLNRVLRLDRDKGTLPNECNCVSC